MVAYLMTIFVDTLQIEDPVILAPMSGVTDAPFRRLVKQMGVGLVVSEMIASRSVIQQTRESMRRAQADAPGDPFVIQLAGTDGETMAEAARLCEDLGAAMIDINMGCPVKKVAKGQQAGAALMRDEVAAGRLLEATVNAVSVPVALKMRTGWEDSNRNAPSLARIAERSGVKLVTVHGRTRAQGFGGRADWDFIAWVKAAVSLPVIANGDVNDLEDAQEILARSGADGVMIGRGACGRPWFPGAVMRFLRTGRTEASPSLEAQRDIVLHHYEELLRYYGAEQGRRVARKHLGWYLEKAGIGDGIRRAVVREDSPARVKHLIRDAYQMHADRRAA